MSSSADRLRAARLLLRIAGGGYASRLLAGGGAPGVRTRVLGVLRWQRALDAVLERRCRTPWERLDREVRITLRIGLFEAVQLGVPPAVAVDAAVHLVRRLGRSSASGLVNAVLRRAIPGWTADLANVSPDLRLSHPRWLYERWREAFGEGATVAAMTADQEPAPVWAWFLDEGARRELCAEGVALEAHPWCGGAWRTRDEVRPLLAVVEEGRAYVQDPSSQLVAHVVLALAAAGDDVVELCAAPGGKMGLLLKRGRWGRALALDLHLRRTRLMQQLFERLGGGCRTSCADATRPPVPPSRFQVVVLDAPCSGTGTLRRHPELRWRLSEEAISERAVLQRRLLDAGLRLVAPDGVLVYATCSVEPEENEALFEPLPPGFAPVDIEGRLPSGTPWRPAGAGVRILPGADGDGFTMHAVRRTS